MLSPQPRSPSVTLPIVNETEIELEVPTDRHMLVVGAPYGASATAADRLGRVGWQLSAMRRASDACAHLHAAAVDVVVVHLVAGRRSQLDEINWLRRVSGDVPIAVVLGPSRVGDQSPRLLWYTTGPLSASVRDAVIEACRPVPARERRRRVAATTTPVFTVA